MSVIDSVHNLIVHIIYYNAISNNLLCTIITFLYPLSIVSRYI